jgi:tetratricopeptide (TPR) repeat protein
MQKFAGKLFRPLVFSIRWALRHFLISLFSLVAVAAFAYFFALPALAEHWFHKAQERLEQDKLEEATEEIEKALRLQPRNPNYLRLAARIDRLAARFLEARQRLQLCVQLEKQAGGSAETQLEWLLVRAEMGEVDDVVDDLHKLVMQKHPESEHIIETLARAYVREARYGPAERELLYWVLIYPASAKAFEWRGMVREQVGQYDSALLDYRQAVELNPNRFRGRLLLVQMLFTSLKLDEIGPHLQVLLQMEPNNRNVLYFKANLMYEQGKKPAEIHPILVKVLEADPNEPNALLLMSKVEIDLKQYAEAEEHLQRILAADESNAAACFAMAECLRNQRGRTAEQLDFQKRHETINARNARLQSLLKTAPSGTANDLGRMVELGELLIWSKQENQGAYWLFKVLDKDPNNVKALELMADYYERHGMENKAKAHRDLAAKAAQKTEP